MQQTDHIQRSPGSRHSDLGLMKDKVVPKAALTFKTQLTVSSTGYRTQDITGVLLQARCYQTVCCSAWKGLGTSGEGELLYKSLCAGPWRTTPRQSNSLDTCAEFRIKYVGAIEKLDLSQGKSLQGPLDLINYIDVAQQDGKLPFVPLEEEFILGVSKYGIKVSTTDQHGVLHRHALYLIIRMVCYDDGLGAGKSLLALKTTDASNEEYSLWVYQCNSLVRHLDLFLFSR
ncbi:Integrin beta-1-binding protein 1 [Microtus ochrogaster]|uniref:Integrin beta-1-binding protein 1 n=1 Tax=Microtus ochrogaster TaxID=79684 RepID=A0A8J6GWJ7_MICOH|nr:Integrin beta-1-binding protein 1 [Microtus ochrogaster]